MPETFDLLALGGDGIGPEVIGCALKVVEKACDSDIRVDVTEGLLHGACYEKTGTFLEETTLDHARRADAVLVGATGGSRWDSIRPAGETVVSDGLMQLRMELDAYAGLRPARAIACLEPLTPYRPGLTGGADVLVLREMTGGNFFAAERGVDRPPQAPRRGYDLGVYDEHQIARLAHVGFRLAGRRRRHLVSADKSNVMEMHVLWREVVSEIAPDYPGITLEHLYADNASYQLTRLCLRPTRDVAEGKGLRPLFRSAVTRLIQPEGWVGYDNHVGNPSFGVQKMTIARSVGEVLENHVTLELECLDRLYLNAYVPMLQTGGGAAWFFREVRGNPVPSSALMAPMTRRFVTRLERFARDQGVDLVSFRKGERKDDVTQKYLRLWSGGEGVLYVGKAQEKARVLRTQKRVDPATGRSSCELVHSTAMVNAWYIYIVDDDFGPCFIKFCSYFPYNAKLCLNGHEYLKRQLSKRGVAFEALDNGILSCADPRIMQAVAGEIDASRIDALFRKWTAWLPHPFTDEDAMRGIRYDLSILQAECALTQVFDRPLHGRILFEEIMRENLDIGRPDHVQLIFNRRITRRTTSRFRTRVITDGVQPSLHVDYKHSRIKQYFKEGRALRTETVINNTYDFGIKRRLINLDDLKEVGFHATRRLLDVQRISHDCPIGAATFDALHQPVVVDERRVSALRFGDPRIQAVLAAILLHVFLPMGFNNRQMREAVADLLSTDTYGSRQATYDLRRLRLRGLIERIPSSHRYRLTQTGQRIALAYCRIHRRTLSPALAAAFDDKVPSRLGHILHSLDDEVSKLWEGQTLAA